MDKIKLAEAKLNYTKKVCYKQSFIITLVLTILVSPCFYFYGFGKISFFFSYLAIYLWYIMYKAIWESLQNEGEKQGFMIFDKNAKERITWDYGYNENLYFPDFIDLTNEKNNKKQIINITNVLKFFGGSISEVLISENTPFFPSQIAFRGFVWQVNLSDVNDIEGSINRLSFILEANHISKEHKDEQLFVWFHTQNNIFYKFGKHDAKHEIFQFYTKITKIIECIK